MKKFLLAVSAVLVLGQTAEATTRKSVLAQFTSAPIEMGRAPAIGRGASLQVVIHHDGDVYGYDCKAARVPKPKPCKAFKLERLSKKEVRNLEALVEGARDGVLKDNGPVFCLAIPNRSFSLTADNGAITLQQGSSPCGYINTNQAPEAKELMDVLKGYMNQLISKVGGQG